jgi:hypothetical protein
MDERRRPKKGKLIGPKAGYQNDQRRALHDRRCRDTERLGISADRQNSVGSSRLESPRALIVMRSLSLPASLTSAIVRRVYPRLQRAVRPIGWVVPVAGCGFVVEDDMFDNTHAALSPNLGEVCESYPHAPNEASVDDNVECAPGYCVTLGADPGGADGFGVCSCRCDGPPGRAPFCRCAEGFACEEVIKRIPGIPSSDEVAGSYCMPSH